MDATVTLNQLTQSSNGIGVLAAMTGAKNFAQSTEENFVSFKLPKGVHVKIKLNAMDTYDMSFGKIRKFEYKVTKEIKGLYADMLKEAFENHTGLYLSF
jgi:hypothetical protein